MSLAWRCKMEVGKDGEWPLGSHARGVTPRGLTGRMVLWSRFNFNFLAKGLVRVVANLDQPKTFHR